MNFVQKTHRISPSCKAFLPEPGQIAEACGRSRVIPSWSLTRDPLVKALRKWSGNRNG